MAKQITEVVYFVQVGGSRGPIKIGGTGSIKSRLIAIQCCNPRKCRLLGSIPSPNVFLEEWVQKKFSAFRIRGEWFRADPKLIEWMQWAIANPGDASQSHERELRAKLLDRLEADLSGILNGHQERREPQPAAN